MTSFLWEWIRYPRSSSSCFGNWSGIYKDIAAARIWLYLVSWPGPSGFVRQAFLSLVVTSRCYCWANGASLPEKDLKRTAATATEILIWTICVFLPSIKAWLWGVGRLEEGHSEVKRKAPRNSLLLTGFNANWFWWPLEIHPFHQIQRDLDNSMYKLSLKFPQEVTTFTMKKKSLKI